MNSSVCGIGAAWPFGSSVIVPCDELTTRSTTLPGSPTCKLSTSVPPGKLAVSLLVADVTFSEPGYQNEKP